MAFWRISYSRSIGAAAFGATVHSHDDPVKARKALRLFYPFMRKEIYPATDEQIARWRERQAQDEEERKWR